jgi:hypothetical protein
VIGVDPEAELLFVRTPKRELLALDLEGGRIDTVATDATESVLGPDGTLYSVDSKHKVSSLARRVRETWPQPLNGPARELFGSSDQRLVAVVTGAHPELVTVEADHPPVSRPLPAEGDVAASRWGDLVAIASDSGVILLDPLGRREAGFVRLDDHPRALVFSPSAHRVYVGLRGALGLAVIDRFTAKELDGIALPTPVSTIRLDPFGQWLLARPDVGDTAWVVNLPIKQLVGGLPAVWRNDLPTVTPDGSLLAREGDDVAAFAPESLKESGRVAGGASDFWITTSWGPRGAVSQSAQATAADTGGGGGEEGPLYVQVSVSQNQTWSEQMAQQLTRAGLAAKVLPPTTADEGFRVVLGPYTTRTQAEAIGRKLGRPYWIYRPGQ